MDELFYREYILEHYRNPHNYGRLERPDATFEDDNPLCGDRIRVDLKVEDGRIADVRFEGKGCAISQASMSMLSDAVKGMTLEETLRLGKDEMLENLGAESIAVARIKCATLGLKVLKEAALAGLARDGRSDAEGERT
ncbi:MAG TPA: SUF system NifU family Fe-S cluster assembly protein [Candidatus Dormibacteraeota bacterium]|nr:SUF system NifU family Fe-S cluster assembly protein [Candidatus Dormibacteraeota bacterium]